MEYTEYIGIYYYMKRQIIHVTGPRCSGSSRNLRFPDYVTMAQNDGKVVRYAPAFFYPQEILLVLISFRD